MTGLQKTVVTLAVLLAVSVCANAFMAGALLSRPKGPPMMGEQMMAGRPGGINPREMFRELPPELRGKFSESFQDGKGEVLAGMRGVMQARRGTLEALKAEPFDVSALQAALEAQRQAQLVVQTSVHNRLASVIAELSPEERAQVTRSTRKLFK